MGSDLILRARKVIEGAEAELRRLAASAASAGRYEEVVALAELARAIANVCQGESCQTAPTHTNGAEVAAPTVNDGAGEGSYPRYFRRGDQLVKIGWSKKNRAVYEHHAPKEVLFALLAALSRSGAHRKPIAIESLTPLRTRDNEEIPNYQVYLTLALLREKGIVEQRGRKGYVTKRSKQEPIALGEGLWSSLALAQEE